MRVTAAQDQATEPETAYLAAAAARDGIGTTVPGRLALAARSLSSVPPSLKKATQSSIAFACSSSIFAVAAFCSTSAEFCCVASSI